MIDTNYKTLCPSDNGVPPSQVDKISYTQFFENGRVAKIIKN